MLQALAKGSIGTQVMKLAEELSVLSVSNKEAWTVISVNTGTLTTKMVNSVGRHGDLRTPSLSQRPSLKVSSIGRVDGGGKKSHVGASGASLPV